jgi:hypothetical protein
MKKALILASLALQLGGCAAMNSRAMSYRNEEGGNQRVFLWGSQYSAGIGSNNGVCAQPATTARTTSASGEANAGVALVQALQPALDQLSPGEAARVGFGITQSVMLTNATNPQTAYANIAYFYLCQIALNNKQGLGPDHIVQMWTEVSRTISTVALTGVEPPRIVGGAPHVPERRTGTTGVTTDQPSVAPSSAPAVPVQPPVPEARPEPR